MTKVNRRVKSVTASPLKRKKPRRKNSAAVKLRARLKQAHRKRRMHGSDIKFDKIRGKHLARKRSKKTKHSLSATVLGRAIRNGVKKVEGAISKAGKPVRDSADRVGAAIKKHTPKIGKAARKTVDVAKTGSLYLGGGAVLYTAHQATKDR
jgi:hypothetical protein